MFFLLRGDRDAASAGRNNGFGLFAINSTTCLIKDVSSSPVSIRREKELRGKDVEKEKRRVSVHAEEDILTGCVMVTKKRGEQASIK